MKKFFLLLTLIIICACNSNPTSHGTNPQDIAGFLDFETCKPQTVEYETSHTGRSTGNLGPIDYNVEAVLYYDSDTFSKFRELYAKAPIHDNQVTKSTFSYTWLPKAVKDELTASPETQVYQATALTQNSNPHCYLWFLNNKVLVYYFTM